MYVCLFSSSDRYSQLKCFVRCSSFQVNYCKYVYGFETSGQFFFACLKINYAINGIVVSLSNHQKSKMRASANSYICTCSHLFSNKDHFYLFIVSSPKHLLLFFSPCTQFVLIDHHHQAIQNEYQSRLRCEDLREAIKSLHIYKRRTHGSSNVPIPRNQFNIKYTFTQLY